MRPRFGFLTVQISPVLSLCAEFVGNVRFRNEVRNAVVSSSSVLMDGKARLMLARKVVSLIQERNGRFLSRLKGEDLQAFVSHYSKNGGCSPTPHQLAASSYNKFVVVSDKVAIEKAKQCIRHQQDNFTKGYLAAHKKNSVSKALLSSKSNTLLSSKRSPTTSTTSIRGNTRGTEDHNLLRGGDAFSDLDVKQDELRNITWSSLYPHPTRLRSPILRELLVSGGACGDLVIPPMALGSSEYHKEQRQYHGYSDSSVMLQRFQDRGVTAASFTANFGQCSPPLFNFSRDPLGMYNAGFRRPDITSSHFEILAALQQMEQTPLQNQFLKNINFLEGIERHTAPLDARTPGAYLSFLQNDMLSSQNISQVSPPRHELVQYYPGREAVRYDGEPDCRKATIQGLMRKQEHS